MPELLEVKGFDVTRATSRAIRLTASRAALGSVASREKRLLRSRKPVAVVDTNVIVETHSVHDFFVESLIGLYVRTRRVVRADVRFVGSAEPKAGGGL